MISVTSTCLKLKCDVYYSQKCIGWKKYRKSVSTINFEKKNEILKSKKDFVIRNSREISYLKAFNEYRNTEAFIKEAKFEEEIILPDSIALHNKLKSIVNETPDLNSESRVIYIDIHVGSLIPYFKENDILDILVIDISNEKLRILKQKYNEDFPDALGNNKGLRIWNGHILNLPSYMGPVDAIIYNSSFGKNELTREMLIKSISLLKPGGYVMISCPMGMKWYNNLHQKYPDKIRQRLLLRYEWQNELNDLPLKLILYKNNKSIYMTLLQVPKRFERNGLPLFVEGEVILGQGIGSKDMGIPTANLNSVSFEQKMNKMPKGVYFGFTKFKNEEKIYDCVVNVGKRPTFDDKRGVTFEVHILYEFEEDFYGHELQVLLLGYLRPELRFSKLDELLNQIELDIGKTKHQLKDPLFQNFKKSKYF